MIKSLSKKEQLKFIKKYKSSNKALAKECLRLWALISKAKAGNKCEYPGCTCKTTLNSHHFFSKGGFAHLKYDLDNAIVLCYNHHKGGQSGAHCDPDFKEKILGRIEGYTAIRTEQWYTLLSRKAYTKHKLDLNLEYLYLKEEAKKYGID